MVQDKYNPQLLMGISVATTSKINVLIVDDERLARHLVCSLVDKDPELVIVGTCDDGAHAQKQIDALKPDLVFLDIQMPKLNGVELVEKLSAEDTRPYIVFVTAFDEYALKAFEMEALDYLLKPIESDRFNVTVERAKRAIQQKRIRSLSREIAKAEGVYSQHSTKSDDEFLIVKKGDELINLSVSDIVWIEAASQYVNIHTVADSYIMAESLKAYHDKLPPDMFVRVHRSAVVNRNKLTRVYKKPNGVHALELRDGSVVPLARSRKQLLTALLRDCPVSSSINA